MRSRHSVNGGIGKEFYRKGNSLKRFRPFSESPDSTNSNLLRSSPSQISTPTLDTCLDSPLLALASRKRCDFENTVTLRFEIALQKHRSDFSFLKVWAPLTCLCCFTGKNIAIWNLRFRSAAIRDFIPRFFCDFSVEPAVRVTILNLRFENAAIAIAIFWDA